LEEFERTKEEDSDVLTYNFEINDYPANARQKVMSREFLSMIHDLTNCNVTIRGIFCDPSKKLPAG